MKTFLSGLEGVFFSLTSLGLKNKFGLIVISFADFSVNWNNLLNSAITASMGTIIGFFIHLLLKYLYKKYKSYGRNDKTPS